MKKIAINGFGRIGRLVLRAMLERPELTDTFEVVAINDLGDPETCVHLFNYDSVHGNLVEKARLENDSLVHPLLGCIPLYQEKKPADLDWQRLGVDLVLECSGAFTTREKAQLHLDAGAPRLLISAPTKGADITIVYGVNHQKLTADHKIISNASCTTNCLAPLAKILDESVGIEHGFMTTIHSYTGDQRLVDTDHKDLRRARAAALSMIPTTTGAAIAVGDVLPQLKGKLDGTSIRVPTANVSVVDLTFVSKTPTTTQDLNKILEKGAQDLADGVVDLVTEPLVSCDFNHSAFSSSIDLTQTTVTDKTLCRVLSWYDNEWGFSNRMLDTALKILKH